MWLRGAGGGRGCIIVEVWLVWLGGVFGCTFYRRGVRVGLMNLL